MLFPRIVVRNYHHKLIVSHLAQKIAGGVVLHVDGVGGAFDSISSQELPKVLRGLLRSFLRPARSVWFQSKAATAERGPANELYHKNALKVHAPNRLSLQ